LQASLPAISTTTSDPTSQDCQRTTTVASRHQFAKLQHHLAQQLRPFKAPWWLKNAHLQTILAKYLAPRCALNTQAEMVELPDGDELQLNWSQTPAAENGAAIVVILHGLEGNIDSHYIQQTMDALRQSGQAAVLMHFRGCAGRPNKRTRAYHSGDTADFAVVLQLIQQRYPQSPLFAVGFSLGGNVLAKYCGEIGANNPLTAAMVIGAPLQLAASASRINQGFSKRYQTYLLGRLKRNLQRKMQHHADFPLTITSAQWRSLQTIRQFDELYTAPIHGFRNADDYYQRSSALPYLTKVAIPMLLIHADDDPFLSPSVLPTDAQLSDCIMLVRSTHGGHIGFVEGSWPWQRRYWLSHAITTFVGVILDALRPQRSDNASETVTSYHSSVNHSAVNNSAANRSAAVHHATDDSQAETSVTHQGV